MATRTLNVQITGDSRSLNRALDQTEKHTKTWGTSVTKSFALVGAAAAGAVAVGLGKAAKAAVDAEASMAKVKVMVDNAGISFDKHSKQIDKVIQAQSRLSGFDDEELAESFGNMLRTTGDLNKAFELNALAADVARSKGIELAGAQSLLARVYNGSFNGVKRLGVAVEPVTKAQDALKASTDKATDAQKDAAKKTDDLATRGQVLSDLQKKFGGQAEAYGKTTAGAFDKANVAAENLGEVVGAALLPALAGAAQAGEKFVQQLQNGEGLGGTVAAVFKGTTDAIKDLYDGFKTGADGARDLAAGLAIVAGGIGAAKVVTALKTALSGLSGIMTKNPIGLAAAAIGGLASAVGILSIHTQNAEADTRDFNDALRAQADALRAVRDIDIDVAQRKANVKSANVAVAQSEKRLHDLRKSGKASSLELDQAEADLTQSKVSQARANRELARSEEDSKRKKDDAKTSTKDLKKEEDDLNGEINNSIRAHQRHIDALEKVIGEQQRYGGNTKETRDNVEALRAKQKQLRDEINHLKSKRVDVDVAFKLTPAPGSVYGSQGDGIGQQVHRSVTNLAQGAVNSGKILPVGPASLDGADADLAPFAAFGAGQGLHVSSGLRVGAITSSGNKSFHSSGDAIDMAGSPGGMMNFFRSMKSSFGSRLRELIYTPGGAGIKDGQPFNYTGQVAADHYNHVHLAYTGPFGDGIGQAVDAAYKAGFRGNDLVNMVAIAGRESSYRNSATNISARDHSIGLWQINQLAHHGRYGTDAELRNPFTNARAAYKLFKASGLSPWQHAGGPLGDTNVAQARKAVAAYKGGKKGSGGTSSAGGTHWVTDDTYGPGAHPGTRLDQLEMAGALAELTSGTGDDIKAADALVKFWRGKLAKAKKSGSAKQITAAAQGLRSARDARAALNPSADSGGGGTSTADDSVARLAAAQEESNKIQAQLLTLTKTQGPQMLAAVIAAVNGSIGGSLGLGGFQATGVPGQLARY